MDLRSLRSSPCLRLALVWLLLATALTCDFARPEGVAPVAEVTMMLDPADRARTTWQELSEKFNREHPGIRFRIIWSDITKKIHLLAAANALPDLILIPDFRLATYHGSFLDLDDFLKSIPGDGDEFYPPLLAASSYEGKLKTLPVFYNVPFVFYRPDLFEKAGVPLPDKDWKWEDYRSAAKALTEREADGSVKRFGTNIQYGWWVEWLSLIRQAGGDLLDEKGNLVIGGRGTLPALEFMHDLIYADGSAPTAARAPIGGFLSGRYAMYYGGHVSELGTLRKTATFPWAIAPLPAGPAGRATGELAVAGVGVWKGSRNRDAALKVLRFLATKGTGEALCRAGLPPVRKDVARDVFLKPAEEGGAWHPEVLIDSLEFASSVPKLRDFSPLALGCIEPAIGKALNNPNRGELAGLPQALEAQAKNYLKTLAPKSAANPLIFAGQMLVIAFLLVWLVRRYLRKTAPSVKDRWALGHFLKFSAPCLLGIGIFTVGPLVLSFWWAQTDYDMVNPVSYVGFNQYRMLLFGDPDFWHSLALSLIYAVVHVPLALMLSLGAALLLNQELRHIGVFRTLFYLPSILPVASSGLMWAWFLHPRYGLVNEMLSWFGIRGPGWLQDAHWAMPALLIISLWSFGGSMLIFLAGLKNIPAALYEAAEIDGAGSVSRFFHITLPSLAPVIFFNLTIGIIGALQVFDLAYVVAGGGANAAGPEKSLYFYVLNLYEKSFVHLNVGVGSAMAWLFFVVVAGITVVNFWAKKIWWKAEGATE